MNRVHRLNYGPDFRGHKPIQVCLVNYRDKEEILRKARLLKGSNIYISEDFSRKVREHRNELIKFMKEVKTRDPTRRMTLRYDKLYVGNDVFFFNDRTGRVERLHTPLDETKMNQNFNNLMGVPEPNVSILFNIFEEFLLVGIFVVGIQIRQLTGEKNFLPSKVRHSNISFQCKIYDLSKKFKQSFGEGRMR